MQRKTVLIIACVVFLFAILALHTSYLGARVRSAIINSSIEDVPGTSPAGVYPLLLLHGFTSSYSKRVSEFSLNNLQEELAQDLAYTNKGLLLPETTCAELRFSEKPIIVRASYLNGIGEAAIGNYAENVWLMVEKLLSCTGAEKVDIITHSMGGIVVRQYLSSTNATSVRMLIMIATPNHGGLYNIGALADYLAKQDEPLDIDFLTLSENSVFMGDLNSREEGNNVEYITIAGDIDGKGDGVVLKESVPLQTGDHHIVPCNHLFIKSPLFCPEAYDIIKDTIKNSLHNGRPEEGGENDNNS